MSDAIPQHLHNLQSPFYRVALKAVIRDETGSILFLKNSDGNWELPGGGWEHGEQVMDCLDRELSEEAHVNIKNVGDVLLVHQGISEFGWHVVRVLVEATTVSRKFEPDDGMTELCFADKETFLRLPMDLADEPLKAYAEKLWPNS